MSTRERTRHPHGHCPLPRAVGWGHLTGHHQTMAVLHEGMAQVAEGRPRCRPTCGTVVPQRRCWSDGSGWRAAGLWKSPLARLFPLAGPEPNPCRQRAVADHHRLRQIHSSELWEAQDRSRVPSTQKCSERSRGFSLSEAISSSRIRTISSPLSSGSRFLVTIVGCQTGSSGLRPTTQLNSRLSSSCGGCRPWESGLLWRCRRTGDRSVPVGRACAQSHWAILPQRGWVSASSWPADSGMRGCRSDPTGPIAHLCQRPLAFSTVLIVFSTVNRSRPVPQWRR